MVFDNELQASRIESLEELEGLPNYVKNINIDLAGFGGIISWYLFEEAIPCQRSGCHTPHKLGYVIKLSDGGITNIGNECGRKFGSYDFIIGQRKLKNFTNRQNRKEALIQIQQQIASFPITKVRKDCETLKGAQTHLENRLGRELMSNLKVRALRRDFDVVKDSEYFDKKAKEYKYRQNRIGRFSDLDFIVANAQEIYLKIANGIEGLQRANLEELNLSELKKIFNKYSDAKLQMDNLTKLRNQQNDFFGERNNYKLLLNLADDLVDPKVNQIKANIKKDMRSKFS